MSEEIPWSVLRERQLNAEMDSIASYSTAKIVEYKLDEQLAAQYRKQTEAYKRRKAEVIADRTQIIYATGNNQ